MKSLETLKYKTLAANKQSVMSKWYQIDAEHQIVGRLASHIALLLSGKNHKTNFTPHVACGDHVVVVNADKVKFTGNKEKDKTYIRHTRYPGGQRMTKPWELRAKDPTQILRCSVKGMMMKNRLGRKLMSNLFIYPGSQHPHQAQQVEKVNLTSR